MQADVGDEIVVESEIVGRPARRGRVVEVVDRAGAKHYRVRWDDGRESLYYPGADAHVTGRDVGAEATPLPPQRARPPRLADPVRSIMTSPVSRIASGASLREVAQVLDELGVGALVVVQDEVPVGIVSERDVVRALAEGGDPEQVWAGDVMAPDPVWARGEDSIALVATVMRDVEVRHVPVRDRNGLVGIVSLRDVLDVLLAG